MDNALNGYQPRRTLGRLTPPNQGSNVQPLAAVTVFHSVTIHNPPSEIAPAPDLHDMKRILAKLRLRMPLSAEQQEICGIATLIAEELKEAQQ